MKFIFIIKKVFLTLLLLFSVTVTVFLTMSFSSYNTAESIVRMTTLNPTTEQIEQTKTQLGLDKPIAQRYYYWLKNLFKDGGGKSYMTRKPVIDSLKKVLPVSIMTGLLSLVWIVLLTLFFGLMCVKKPNGYFDKTMQIVCAFGVSVPTFWFAYILLLIFSVHLDLIPATGNRTFVGLLLPSFTLAFPSFCAALRLFRATLLKEMAEDYVLYLKSRGISESSVLRSHVLKNAMPPMVTWFASYLGYMIAGSAVIENIFSLRGLGPHLIAAVLANDVPTISTSVLIIACGFIMVNFIADMINLMLSPKIFYTRKIKYA